MIKAYKLYTGADGHSHMVTGRVAEQTLTQATGIRFQETPSPSAYDWHCAPTTQYVLTLLGTLEFVTASGESFIVKPGEVLLALDTTGSGHKWRLLDEQPWKRAYITFAQDTQVNLLPD